MREYMRIVEEANRLDWAYQALADYIIDNTALENVGEASRILLANGYVEPVRQTTFFRVLFHQITDQDRAGHKTIGDLFGTFQREVRFDLSRGGQGFTVSLERAITYANGYLHMNHDLKDWPVHHPEAPLDGVKTIAIIYEVECDPSQIMWSMAGLKQLMERTGDTGPGYQRLKDNFDDWMYGYGGDEEVFIDTHRGCRVLGQHLYDVREHYPHADERDWG